MNDQHTAKAFDNDLQDLARMVAEMGGLAEKQIADSVSALARRDTVLAQRVSQVPGVGEVTVSGADQPAVRIALNPVALSNAGIATDDVRLAIINANPLGPVGIFNGGRQSETLSINKQMRTAAEFRDIVIKSANGNFVRLSDVAEVEDSVRNNRSIAWFNKQPAVLIQITKQGDANVIDTVDRVRALIEVHRDALLGSFAAIARVRAAAPHAPILGFAGHGNVDAIKRAREGGATVLARSGFTVQLPALLTEVADRERARVAG